MKNFKIISIGLVLLFAVTSINGQTEKGKFLVGGESKLDFSSTSYKWKSDDADGDYGKSLDIEFSPMVGYFISDGLAVGAHIPIMFSSEKDEDDDKYTTTVISFAPFVRYYFGTTNIKPFLHGGVGFGSAKGKYEPVSGTSNESTYGMFSYAVGGGVAMFLTESIALDFGLEYGSSSFKEKEDNDTNFKDIDSGIGFNVGIVVELER